MKKVPSSEHVVSVSNFNERGSGKEAAAWFTPNCWITSTHGGSKDELAGFEKRDLVFS